MSRPNGLTHRGNGERPRDLAINARITRSNGDRRRNIKVGSTLVARPAEATHGALLDWFTTNLRQVITDQGYRLVEPDEATDEGGIVLYPVDAARPRSFRRKNRAIFVVGIGETEDPPDQPLKTGYPFLLRTLANLFIQVVRNGRNGNPEVYFFTLEQGFYNIPYTGDDESFFNLVLERLAPLATSNLIVENDFVKDLPEELWDGDEVTASITRAGRKLDDLDLLPSPFPLEEYLSEKDLRHVKQLFNIGGLSYGNLSARKDETRFWMSASGVDKSRLETIGQEILLVTDYIPERQAMRLSVPPHITPRRVSVDAIEHWMIYREHPSVGAILHIHAWMKGISSTHINFPCGTYELASSVAELVRQAPDPGHAVIGLKNHGLTITGESLDEIFDRIDGKVLRQVPMS
jgi:ribulose-5-phosphate 4-epimerase/fuculose-1-phosphate aldolase